MADVLSDAVEKVKIADLVEYPKNPRKGNVDLIAQSLKENGQFRPLVVQRQADDGTANVVLGGNHTLKGAKKLRWKTIKCVFVDVDDEAGKRIVLADNRLSDMASYDGEILSEILSSLEKPHVGTGYDTAAIQSILTSVVERDADLLMDVINDAPAITFSGDDEDLTFDERMERSQKSTAESPALDDDYLRGVLQNGDDEQAMLQGKQRRHAEIQVAIEELVESILPSTDYWGIPDMKLDMIPEKFPDKFETWADQATTPDDGVTEFFFQWGTSNGKDFPWERGWLGFFTDDSKWDSWYMNTGYLVAKMVMEGLKYAVAPDNSVTLGMPRYMHLKANYEGQWLARILQEAGIKVTPNLRFTDPESAKLAMAGIPKGTPTVMTCIQSIDEKQCYDLNVHTTLRSIVKELQPENLIVYGGPPAERVLEAAKIPASCNATYMENYSSKRNKALKGWHKDKQSHDGAVRKVRKQRAATAQEEPVPDEAVE